MRVSSVTRTLANFAAVSAIVIAAAACSSGSGATASVEGGWDDVVAAAESEGSVLLYSSQNTTVLDSMKKAWGEKYPNISLEYVRGTDADLMPRIETENKTGRGTADVHVLTDPSWIESAAESGAYSQVLRGDAFDAADYDRDRSVKNDRFFLDVAATLGMGWNTNSVPSGLSDPRDVLDPQYRGRVGVVNPSGIAAYVDLYRFYRNNFGDDFVDRLAEQNPRIYPSALGVSQALTSGEVVVSPMVQPLVQEKNTGAPVDWALPSPSWGTPFYGHITSVAPHPNAAQVLANFLVSPEGQRAQAIGVATALPGIEGATADAHDVVGPDPAELTPEFVEKQSRDWEQKFQG